MPAPGVDGATLAAWTAIASGVAFVALLLATWLVPVRREMR
jgi:hypothetical protein